MIIRFAVGVFFDFELIKKTCPKNVLGTQPPPPLKERIQHEMIFLRIGNVPIVHFLVEISDRFRIKEFNMK